MEWPEGRYFHAATCMSGPLLVIVGGNNGQDTTISDCWIGDLTKDQWMKVYMHNCIILNLIICLFQLTFPNFITERVFHSLSAIRLSSHCVLLVIFGGRSLLSSATNLSHTVLIELSKYNHSIVHAVECIVMLLHVICS